MEFEEYNGWKNYPTWDIYTQVTSYEDSYHSFEQAAGRNRVKETIEDNLKLGMKRGWQHEAIKGIVSDWCMSGVRHVDWSWLHNTLVGEKEIPRKPDELTTEALHFLRSYPQWREILKGVSYMSEGDERLRDWAENQLLTWIESTDARRYDTSTNKFARKIIDLYSSVVDWTELTSALRGE